jgi:dihydroneopterin aldolase/2-amino-4-hydroxy-6-hydroxymethyldihydropteridine diphosphokinase/dihydropteroate synthase
LALGSNLGDKEANLRQGLALLAQKVCRVVATSALYQTPPAYVLDQPPFLNAACKAYTSLSPVDLLAHIKQVERDLGRLPGGQRYGPRLLDIDILFYDDLHLHTFDEKLIIPHIRLHERDFVLGPLRDIAPDFVHPVLKLTVSQLFANVCKTGPPKLEPILPIKFGLGEPPLFWRLQEKTFIMGIVNVTPDSFSDGGDNFDIQNAVHTIKQMVQSGVDIIDIGGQSTRPSSTLLSPEEEAGRVIPLIKTLRADATLNHLPISVDTFYADVAEQAIKAGANIINDISGGTMDARMLKVASELAVPIVLMHIRGTPQTMQNPENTDYGSEDGLVQHVVTVLRERADQAQRMGIPRWNIILDPGIGFAKTADHNLILLRRLSEIRDHVGRGYCMLIGASRKRFIGSIVGGPAAGDPKQRRWGTAATTVAAVVGGAHFVRVHDVDQQRQVLAVADAIYKNKNYT